MVLPSIHQRPRYHETQNHGPAAGIYTLPILIAPPAPDTEQVAASQQQAKFHGTFRRDLKDSDRLHWGEGKVSIGPDAIRPINSMRRMPVL